MAAAPAGGGAGGGAGAGANVGDVAQMLAQMGGGGGASGGGLTAPRSRFVGVDWGSTKCVVAYVSPENRHSAIISNNEISKIDTLNTISFKAGRRLVGEAARGQARHNLKNTVVDLVRLLGNTKAGYEAVSNNTHNFTIGEADGRLDVTVDFKPGEAPLRLPTELVASMMLSKLGQYASKKGGDLAQSDILIAVPPSYTARQRKAMLDAAALAKLSNVSLVDSIAALAANYRIKHSHKIDSAAAAGEAHNVMFVDIGAQYASVGIVAFTPAGGRVLACRSSPSMGCSAIEHRLAVVAREAVQEKHSVAVKPQSSRGVRVLYECEKAKKVLSTVPMYTLEIDNVAPDVDARIPVRRTQLEESCKDMATACTKMVTDVLEAASMTPSDLVTAEFVGGGTRIPFIKQALTQALGDLAPAFTLDGTAGVAQGAALLASERNLAQADLLRKALEKLQATTAAVPEPAAAAAPPAPSADGDSAAAAAATEDTEMAEPAATEEPATAEEPAAATTQATSVEEEEQQMKVVVGSFVGADAASAADSAGLSAAEREAAEAIEATMAAHEAELQKEEAVRNDLESYILSTRSAMRGSDLLDDDKLGPVLMAAEDWLYSDEAHGLKPHVDKLAEIKSYVETTFPDYFAEKQRKAAQMEAELQAAQQQADAEKEAAEAAGEIDDHDRRKLKTADRLRLLLKNKEEGNELFGGGNYKAAAIRYVKALNHGSKFHDVSDDDQKDIDKAILSCHLNVAMCYLKMEMWRKAREACKSALAIDANNSKAMYRQATACLELKDVDGAESIIKRAREVDPENKAVAKVARKIAKIRAREAAQRKRMAKAMFG